MQLVDDGKTIRRGIGDAGADFLPGGDTSVPTHRGFLELFFRLGRGSSAGSVHAVLKSTGHLIARNPSKGTYFITVIDVDEPGPLHKVEVAFSGEGVKDPFRGCEPC